VVSAFDADYVQVGTVLWGRDNSTSLAAFGYNDRGPIYSEYAIVLGGDDLYFDNLAEVLDWTEQVTNLVSPTGGIAPGRDILLSSLPGVEIEPGIVITLQELAQNPIGEIMDEVRDYGGNDLGSADSWQSIGQADIQGDGDNELIYVSTDLGRWATLGIREDGTIDFTAHGEGGDTRIVGTYIDPLVQSGIVQQGSGFDSQLRFENDLKSGNLGQVLGAGDYDGDGFQEVYFGLGDASAVLHAYMHADGNIRYANYQSESDLVSFMDLNGVSSAVYDSWF
jgi:hypothetical protein